MSRTKNMVNGMQTGGVRPIAPYDEPVAGGLPPIGGGKQAPIGGPGKPPVQMTGADFEKRKAAMLADVAQVQAVQLGPAEQAEVVTANAITREVAPEETSQFQLDKMLASDSALMKRARTQGLQQGAQRGLLNSNLAVESAQGAMIDRAQPFAINDAATYFNTAESNMKAQNNAELQNARLSTETNIFNTSERNAFTTAQASLDSSAAQANAAARNSALNNFLDRENQVFLQESAQAFTAAENAADRTLKETLQTDMLAAASFENALDRSQQTKLQDDAQAYGAEQNELNRDLQLTMQNNQISAAASQQAASLGAQASMQASALGAQASMQAASFANALEMQTNQYDQQIIMQENQNAFTAAQNELAIEAQVNQTNSQNASAIMLGTMQGVTSIYSDPNLSSTEKQAATVNVLNIATSMPQLLNVVAGGTSAGQEPPADTVEETPTWDPGNNVSEIDVPGFDIPDIDIPNINFGSFR